MTRTLLFLLTLVVCINISVQARRQHHNGDCCNTSANRCCGVGWGLHCCDARGVICCQDEELVALPPRDGPDYKPSPVLTKKHDYFDWDFDWEFDGEWVAISICIIAAVLIFSAAVFCCCRKKRKSNTRLLSDHRLVSGYNYGTLYNTPQAPMFPGSHKKSSQFNQHFQGYDGPAAYQEKNYFVPPPPYDSSAWFE